MTRYPANPIDVVEAAYELDRADRDWLKNLVTHLRPLVDCGLGVMAYEVDMQRSAPTASSLEVQGMSVADAAQLIAIGAAGRDSGGVAPTHLEPESLGTMLQTTKRILGSTTSPTTAAFAQKGVADAIAFRAVQPAGGPGISVLGPSPREVRIDQRARRLWARVAAHISAAHRLRRAHREAPDADVEVVCTPDGRIDDARGEGTTSSARSAVRDAVLRQERSRGPARREDPAEATEAWTALVEGRWSLVDRFERGGRRYIVARRNEHPLSDPRALSQRERAVVHLVALGKSNKLVAYELGLTESTVATHLQAAMRKLGARTRVDLIQLVSSLHRP
ncbi:MAG: helix-turn-helix transcriptional regulator [Kofleriaceae bacterium]|nr:helix-turn-helix transcriptional regulator [Kofleriaceae bacterium]